MQIPSDTEVYLFFGARYIEVNKKVYCSVIGSGWEETSVGNMKEIKGHPTVRFCGTISEPSVPHPPFRPIVVTRKSI